MELRGDIQESIESVVRECGCTFYDIEKANENERNILRVYVTKDGGVDLDACEKISRIISPLLDVEYDFNGEYFLEVSSPGIERSLKKERHFELSIGENITIKTEKNVKIKGKLLNFNDGFIEIETKGTTKKIKLSECKSVRTEFDWDSRK